jgi:subtilisin family serine protease
MKPAVRVVVIASMLLVFAATATAASSATLRRGVDAHIDLASSPSQYVPGEVIVTFRAGSSRVAERRAHSRVGARVSTRFPALRMQLVRLPRGLSVAAAVRKYEADPAVAFAEPNYLRYPTAPPNDTLFSDLWALNNTGQLHPVSDADGDDTADPSAGALDADIDALEAWDPANGNQMGSGTPVAVIDTGADVTHPDLANQLWTNPGETANGLDDDGNNKIDDLYGWDFAENDASLLDAGSHFPGWDHGTHVAGIVAAEANNATGVAGVCPGCKIMVLKIASDANGGALSTAAEIKALAYAKSKGVKIVNMSFGGPQWSNAERTAIKNSGLLAVVAAGNESLDNDMAVGVDLNSDGQADIFSPSYPASYTLPNILTVGASNHADESGYSTECREKYGFSKPRCAFTNWGHDSVDLDAPGVDIESTVPVSKPSDWETWDGTSMAAPNVAGVAGLVLSQNSLYSVAQLKNAVMHSVDPGELDTLYIAPAAGFSGSSGTVALGGGFTRTTGRVNALTALTASTTNATPKTDGNVDGATSWSTAKTSGSVKWPSDVNDVRKRKLSRGRTYKITLVVPAGKDYDLYVWKPGSKEIWQFGPSKRFQAGSATPGSADEVVKFKAGSTGVYYIHVTAWLQEDGRYTLKIARVG